MSKKCKKKKPTVLLFDFGENFVLPVCFEFRSFFFFRSLEIGLTCVLQFVNKRQGRR